MKPKVHQMNDSTYTKVGRILQGTTFYSEWDEDFNLISFKVDGREVCVNGVLDSKHFLYSKAVRGKGRHLKSLKKKLGMADPKVKVKKEVLLKQYNDFPFHIVEIEVGAKMYQNQRVSSVYMFDNTTENRKLAIEHNKLLKELEDLKGQIRDVQNKMK